jgi:D-serine deaminase-like pyridoxal phosphate-dependent protein
MTEEQISTPALVIDLATVERNLQRMQDYAGQHQLNVRPHTKTHKSVYMAGRQLAHGAAGLTVAKVGEAEEMAKAGNDILVAYPYMDPARRAALVELAKNKTVRVAVDNATALEALGDAATSAGVKVGVLVDVDTGFHRTGVQTAEQALKLAQATERFKGLRFDGLFTFPGHIKNKAMMADGQAEVSRTLREVLDLLKKSGIAAPVVSGGSTPTSYFAHHVPEYTEIRPGTYIYNDHNCLAAGWCSIEDCAARLVCTVVSDAVPGKVVLDAGSKALTSDRLGPDPEKGGHGLLPEYPGAKVVRLSEEHGEVDLAACAIRPKVGDRVHVIPNHICPCVNLFDNVYFKRADGSLELARVDARGKVS